MLRGFADVQRIRLSCVAICLGKAPLTGQTRMIWPGIRAGRPSNARPVRRLYAELPRPRYAIIYADPP